MKKTLGGFGSWSLRRWATLIGLIFFLAGILTLPHYGINWDAINHLPRGQAYLHFFLTGKKDFSDLPKFFSEWQKPGQWYWQKEDTLFFNPVDVPKNEVPPVSLYQTTGLDFNYFVENDGGHPPASDILSSVFNLILFQKLRLINDIDSYRIYGVLLAAILVGLIFWWVSKVYGKFAGIISALSLALYPLFWSESHFNTEKDIPETAFWGFLLFSVWQGVRLKKPSWILLSGIFFGLALGTKFNVVFIPAVILPWAIYVAYSSGWLRKPAKFAKGNRAFVISLLAAPILGFAIFFILWPYLWADPIARLGNVIGFYKGIGLTETIDPRFSWLLGINIYPTQWIFYTTPIVILVLAGVGIFVALRHFQKERHGLSLLALLWFLIPIARVSWPGATIYGGIRQIMEYIPALAILAGIGAGWIANQLKSTPQSGTSAIFNFKLYFFIFIFAFLIAPIWRLHPNENVYFNELAGGLSGAREKNIPAWGNSFGAAYRQGVSWLNENAPEGARIAYARELIPNIPRIWLSKEVSLTNGNRSGYLREGEYVIALTYEGTAKTSYYDRYLERFLEPVYEVKVDGVPILKVWKNDEQHTRSGYLREKEFRDFKVLDVSSGIRVDLDEVVALSRIEGDFLEEDCAQLASGYVQISEDGSDWKRLPGTMPGEDWSVPKFGNQPGDGSFLIPFAADEARYVELVINPRNACLGRIKNLKVFSLDKTGS